MMFSVEQKRGISNAVQTILRSTKHPELPTTGEISFLLHVDGAADWSYADIKNNGAVGDPGVNPHNERMAEMSEEDGRTLIAQAEKIAAHPDPRATPDDFRREMLDKQILSANQRLQKAEAIIIDYNKRLNGLELDSNAHEKRLTQLEVFFKEIMEDNLIAHHDARIRELGNDGVTLSEDNKSLHTRINSLETAIRQLGNAQVERKAKKCPDCGIEEGMEHAPDCTAYQTKQTIGDA